MITNYSLECLHAACNGFAPNAAARKGFADLRREMERDSELIEAIAKALSAKLLDGLQYGNWSNG